MVRRGFRELVGLYFESGVSTKIPALAWYLISSLAPLALGLTALASVLLGDYAKAQAVAAEVSGVLPKEAHDQIVALILRTQRHSPLLIAVSILGMVWTASGGVGVIEQYVAEVLDRGEENPLRGKLRDIGVAFGVATLVVLVVILASAGTGLVDRFNVDPTLLRVATSVVAIVAMILICASMFKALARASARWQAALVGGTFSGIVLYLTPTVAGYYMHWVANNTPVKAFLVLTGVLVTCYLVAAGLLLGAGIMARVQVGHTLGAGEERSVSSAD